MSELQKALLDCIHAHIEARQEGPSSKDIQLVFRFRNEAGVMRALEGLAASGHLVCTNDRWNLKASPVQLHFALGGNETDAAGRPLR